MVLDIRYPRKARREGREGEVLVEATMGSDGVVGGARVVKSSGHADLDAAALEGVEAMRGESAAGEVIRVPVVFRCNR